MQASINDIYGEFEFRAFTVGSMGGDGTDNRTWVLKLGQGNNDVTMFFNSFEAYSKAINDIVAHAVELGVTFDE